MLDRSQIPYVHWQMKRSPDGAAVFGEISAELDDLAQSIRQCILTPKRSVPLNPEKGCDLDQFRDRPLGTRNLFIVAEIREALSRDVPRISVHDLIADDTFTSVNVTIRWAPRDFVNAEFITTEVDLAL